MTDRLVCQVETCDRVAHIRGWCKGHYSRVRKYGHAQDDIPLRRRETQTPYCSVSACRRRPKARNLCEIHYQRWQTHGDPTKVIGLAERKRAPSPTSCAVSGCRRDPTAGRGLCSLHYTRWRNHGDATYQPKPRLQAGDRFTDDRTGYVYFVTEPGVYQLEHRVVMEQELGRKLLPGENVHHKNGARGDNRLANLELWVTMQPPGQRVPDKVEFAIEILRRYAPELLVPGGNLGCEQGAIAPSGDS